MRGLALQAIREELGLTVLVRSEVSNYDSWGDYVQEPFSFNVLEIAITLSGEEVCHASLDLKPSMTAAFKPGEAVSVACVAPTPSASYKYDSDDIPF